MQNHPVCPDLEIVGILCPHEPRKAQRMVFHRATGQFNARQILRPNGQILNLVEAPRRIVGREANQAMFLGPMGNHAPMAAFRTWVSAQFLRLLMKALTTLLSAALATTAIAAPHRQNSLMRSSNAQTTSSFTTTRRPSGTSTGPAWIAA
jgi:hypothetical protein